jgi:hypothetical protein
MTLTINGRRAAGIDVAGGCGLNFILYNMLH